MMASMKKIAALILLAAGLSGCTGAYPAPYAVQYGAWSNYDPYYEYGGYRMSDEPISYYGPADMPYGRTYYGPGYGPY
jgi:hypothetical protein